MVSANFRPHVGGVERFVETLACGLAERGHAVTVVCCRHQAAPLNEELGGFRVVRVPASYVLDRRINVPYPLPNPVRLLSVLRHQVSRADVVHVQDAIYATSLPAFMVARRAGVPSILTQHVGFVGQRTAWLDALQLAATATLGRGARLAARVVTLTPTVRDWARERWGLDAVELGPVGVEVPPAPEAERAELRRAFGLPEDRFVALFVGRDVQKKGLDVFLSAHDPAYELVAVTDRPGPHPHATIVPFMSPERLHELRSCVEAFVVTSESEGFPLVLQEAMTVGLPVVSTRVPGFELYLGPEDVLWVERNPESVRSALVRLAADSQLRTQLADRSRSVAEREFGPDLFVSFYERLYRRLADEAQGPIASTQSSR